MAVLNDVADFQTTERVSSDKEVRYTQCALRAGLILSVNIGLKLASLAQIIITADIQPYISGCRIKVNPPFFLFFLFCMFVRLGARRNRLKLVRQATQAAPNSLLG